ncbi:unnamed protein product [Musa acuminata subsp. burmannicoides]
MLSQAKDDGPAGTSTSLKSFSETATTILGGCTCRVAFTTIFFEAIRGFICSIDQPTAVHLKDN